MEQSALGIFAKYWQSGCVKTRLAQSIGSDSAASVAHALLLASAQRFQGIAGRQTLVYAPNDDRARQAFTAPLFEAWHATPQVEGDLGERMVAFFDKQFRCGAEAVVLLGSDSPSLPTERIDQALDQLRTHDVTLGPCDDGGYYLVGLRRPLPALFETMPWSTWQLWQTTLARLNELDVNFATLEPWHDVDDFADLQRLLTELGKSAGRDQALDQLRASLIGAIPS